MKNIHVLPTDKQTRLYLSNYGKELNLASYPKTLYTTGQHIYITNDEEIKEGDWLYVKTTNIYGGNIIAKSLGNGNGCWSYNILTETTDEKGYHPSHCVKIILTDNEDLIKDGVQAIDDEFLEWFVKNSSCEEVEVLTDAYTMQEIFELKLQNGVFKYKIIIPKEEPKQETLENLKNQLKKVIKEHPICVNEDTYWRGVKIGLETAIEVVKLQKQDKKMYSEEEVNNMFATLKINSVNNVATITNVDLFISSWKKQFKKK